MALTLALYQPDIAGNTGAVLRLGACLGVDVSIIEPTGFDMSDRALKRSGMDYLSMVSLTRHVDFKAFERWRQETGRRLVLFTTAGAASYTDIAYRPDDILMFGRESAGVPEAVHGVADLRATIPMVAGARSLNLAVSAGMAAVEALRQVRTGAHGVT
ncbi:MAG: tRNA (cytidine(34)-2'-O)-methyltransferase [Hyphomicrobiales bacterium]|nr:MAG: tRNA (cytidine(34)-2'-O)-methyltransferase [Hyphomicrobiales bacterium]